MRRIAVAAALGAAALVPAGAGATPPDTSGGPLGSAACTVLATGVLPSSCNFTGAAGGLGYAGGSSGGFSLTHVQKANVCTDGKVTGYVAKVVQDAGSTGSGPFYAGPGYAFAAGRVYTFTVKGQGWGIVGGQSTPSPSPPSEPATPSAANSYAGAEDVSSPLGSACTA